MKKILCVIISMIMLVTFSACNTENSESSIPENSNVSAISASLLDGKTANFMGAEGLGIMEETAASNKNNSSASPLSVTSYAATAYDSDDQSQKKTELGKKTEDGLSAICFHEFDGDVKKSYSELNEKYETHHHDGIACEVENCSNVSDEIKAEEENGYVDTVLSLGARVNKLYTIGDFTFVCISSAVEGKIKVITYVSRATDYFSLGTSFPINFEDSLVDGRYMFNWISFTKNGEQQYIPIKVKDSEENYHKINYWNDGYNQSYIIDNNTGFTYSLSQFGYIYSVDGGIIKVYNDKVAGKFDYYLPVSNNGVLSFKKIILPNDQDFVANLDRCKVYTDVYGNMVFSVNTLTSDSSADNFGERKLGDKIIFAQKSGSLSDSLNGLAKGNYEKSNRYHNGSDGRLYRVNFMGDIKNVSVSVLDENCTWQNVEKNITVDFDNAYVVWQVGTNSTIRDSFKMTCIINGYAYFSTAANSDGNMIWPQAFFNTSGTDSDYGYVGVVKMPTEGFVTEDTTIKNFIDEFRYNGLPIDGRYTVLLVGKTQMLYFVSYNEAYLRDVSTGNKKNISGHFYRIMPSPKGNLYVDGLGYLSVEENIDLETFSENSFSAQDIDNRAGFEEYYKLIKGQK